MAVDYEIDNILDIVSRVFPDAGIDAVMIGGHAVNAYGVSRATQDIDFMVAATAADSVRSVMRDAGFSNVAIHETVMFFSCPGSAFRVDFLKVNEETMQKLIANAREVEYLPGRTVRIPRLVDLLAMKIFALFSGGEKRDVKDLNDIASLVLENEVDIEGELLALCREFGSEELYTKICLRIKESPRA